MATALPQSHPSANLSRLISAAVINRGFRDLLLSNPELALATGVNGETFRLDKDERDLVLSIQASSLADFAVIVSRHAALNERRLVKSRRTFLAV